MIEGVLGRLTKAPKVSENLKVNDSTVIEFSVAETVNKGKDNEYTNWFNVTMFVKSQGMADAFLKLEKGAVVRFTDVTLRPIRHVFDPEKKYNNFDVTANSAKIVSWSSGEASEGASAPRTGASPSNRRTTPSRPSSGTEDPFAGDEDPPFDE